MRVNELCHDEHSKLTYGQVANNENEMYGSVQMDCERMKSWNWNMERRENAKKIRMEVGKAENWKGECSKMLYGHVIYRWMTWLKWKWQGGNEEWQMENEKWEMEAASYMNVMMERI